MGCLVVKHYYLIPSSSSAFSSFTPFVICVVRIAQDVNIGNSSSSSSYHLAAPVNSRELLPRNSMPTLHTTNAGRILFGVLPFYLLRFWRDVMVLSWLCYAVNDRAWHAISILDSETVMISRNICQILIAKR